MRAGTTGLGRCFLLGFLLLVSAQEDDTCTSVEVSGGDYDGTYEYDSDTDNWSVGTFVLQIMETESGRRLSLGAPRKERDQTVSRTGGRVGDGEMGMGERLRRVLQTDGDGDDDGGGDDDDECTTQTWVIADGDSIDDGYPYYAAFDCADSPADITSTWMLVSCEDCSEVAEDLSVACTTTATDGDSTSLETAATTESGDGSALTTPAIVAIAVGAAILLCIVCGCCRWRSKKNKNNPKGNHSFADDSEHDVSQKPVVMSGGGRPGEPTGGTGHAQNGMGARLGHNGHNDKINGPPLGLGSVQAPARASVTGAHAAPMQIRNIMAAQEVHVYDPDLNKGGATQATHTASASSGTMPKDSMVAAAAAAARSTNYTGSSTSGGDTQQQQGGGVGFTEEGNAVIPRNAGDPHGDGVVWSAGQNYVPAERSGRDVSGRRLSTGDSFRQPAGARGGGGGAPLPGNYMDSAAGSMYSLNPDNVPDHMYYDDASMPASSPGGYSMYSHFTAGGHTLYGPSGAASGYDQGEFSGDESEDVSWEGEEEEHPLHAGGGGGQKKPPPPPYGETLGGTTGVVHPPLAPLPTLEPVIAPESPITQQKRQQKLMLQQQQRPQNSKGDRQQPRRSGMKEPPRVRSPAGLVARADRSSRASADGGSSNA